MVPLESLIPDIGLRPGDKLCFTVNYSPTRASGRPSGRRVVEGELVGFAVRSPEVLGIALRDISTWNYNDLSFGAERLPEDFVAYYHVLIFESLECTIDILLNGTHEHGRNQLVVMEIPYTSCPGCGQKVEPNEHWRHCANCGERLAVGWVGDYPAVAYPGPDRCPYCWYLKPSRDRGAHCVWCGGRFALQGELFELPAVRTRALLTSGKQRLGRISVVLDSFDFGKKFISQPAKLYAIARDISWERGGAAWRELPSHFVTALEVALVENDVMATLDVVKRGGVVRVSEPLAACQYCSASKRLPLVAGDSLRDNLHASGTRMPRVVRGLYCTTCGQRSRIFPYQWGGRSKKRGKLKGRLRHFCGAEFAASDIFCQGCGGNLSKHHMDVRSGQRDTWAEIAASGDHERPSNPDDLLLLDRFG